ncbi:hypothetical protein EDB83DRAFT_2312576 [Lactarius deliciosus]|nr:hypothetical protein EDB83DRAFT_2312576 [Lactarius deliciosus]
MLERKYRGSPQPVTLDLKHKAWGSLPLVVNSVELPPLEYGRPRTIGNDRSERWRVDGLVYSSKKNRASEGHPKQQQNGGRRIQVESQAAQLRPQPQEQRRRQASYSGGQLKRSLESKYETAKDAVNSTNKQAHEIWSIHATSTRFGAQQYNSAPVTLLPHGGEATDGGRERLWQIARKWNFKTKQNKNFGGAQGAINCCFWSFSGVLNFKIGIPDRNILVSNIGVRTAAKAGPLQDGLIGQSPAKYRQAEAAQRRRAKSLAILSVPVAKGTYGEDNREVQTSKSPSCLGTTKGET